MGFLQARWQSRFGPLKASLLVTVPFAVYHLPSLMVESGLGLAQLHVALAFLGVLAVLQLFGRVVMMWLYNVTGSSVLLVGLWHASFDATTSAFGRTFADPGCGLERRVGRVLDPQRRGRGVRRARRRSHPRAFGLPLAARGAAGATAATSGANREPRGLPSAPDERGRLMTDRFAQTLGGVCGILYVVLLMAGDGLGGPGSQLALSLEVLAFTSFLFFLGSLWGAMRRAEGGGGLLSATAFGAGVMSVTIKLASAAPVLAARANAGELDPNITGVLEDINDASFALTFFPLAAMLAAFALVAIRSAALPGWLGWAAAALSVAFAVGGLAGSADLASDWAGLPMLIFTPWVIATSVVLIRRARSATAVATLADGPREPGVTDRPAEGPAMRSPFNRRQQKVPSAATVTMAALTLLITLAAAAAGVAAGGTLHGAVPEPVPASAPATDFSSARALEHVRIVAREPHPMGSPANAAVRDYLVSELRGLGVAPQVQRATAAYYPVPGFLQAGRSENVLARLPGTDPGGKAFLLAAHYDSVPTSPGATDDGSGVATVSGDPARPQGCAAAAQRCDLPVHRR